MTSQPPPEQPYQNPEQRHAAGQPVQERRRISVGQVLAGILLVLVVIFVVENTDQVTVRLIGPKVTTSLAVALLIAAVAGALISALLRYRRKHHRQNKA